MFGTTIRAVSSMAQHVIVFPHDIKELKFLTERTPYYLVRIPPFPPSQGATDYRKKCKGKICKW